MPCCYLHLLLLLASHASPALPVLSLLPPILPSGSYGVVSLLSQRQRWDLAISSVAGSTHTAYLCRAVITKTVTSFVDHLLSLKERGCMRSRLQWLLSAWNYFCFCMGHMPPHVPIPSSDAVHERILQRACTSPAAAKSLLLSLLVPQGDLIAALRASDPQDHACAQRFTLGTLLCTRTDDALALGPWTDVHIHNGQSFFVLSAAKRQSVVRIVPPLLAPVLGSLLLRLKPISEAYYRSFCTRILHTTPGKTRRTGCSMWEASGVSRPHVAKFAGHADPAMTKRYIHTYILRYSMDHFIGLVAALW